MNSFGDWLQKEMNKQGLTQHGLARMSGLKQGSIGNVIRGERNPGPDFCVSIANALKISPVVVFRAAGLLPPQPAANEKVDEIAHLARGLDPDDLEELIEFMKLKLERKKTKEKSRTRIRGTPDQMLLKDH